MFASVIWDAFAGLGCMVFTLMLLIVGGIALALHLGMLPGLAEALRKIGKGEPGNG